MPLEPATNSDVLAVPRHLPSAVIQRPKRDADGNVLGGVRLPDVEAPLGVHAAQQEPKSFSCGLAGAFLPFTQEQIARRYKGRDDYVNRIRIAARALQHERLLLPKRRGDHRRGCRPSMACERLTRLRLRPTRRVLVPTNESLHWVILIGPRACECAQA